MLPKSKDEFPKCLCLDQNKWINLACAHYGRPEGKPFNEALTAARAAVEAGKLVIPFSWITAIETIAAADAGRRERLATFLIELSANHTILPESEVCPVEIKNAIAQLFGRATTTIIRPLLIEEGFSHALGLDLKTMGPLAGGAAVLRHVHSPEATAAFLLGKPK